MLTRLLGDTIPRDCPHASIDFASENAPRRQSSGQRRLYIFEVTARCRVLDGLTE